MPHLTTVNTLIKNYKQLNFFQKLLFPNELARMLQSADATDFDIYTCYSTLAENAESSCTPTPWSLDCLKEFAKSQLTELWREGKECRLFSGAKGKLNFNAFASAPNFLFHPLKILHHLALLTDANRTTLREHPDKDALFTAFTHLERGELLAKNYVELVLNHPSPAKMAAGLQQLKQGQLLVNEFIETIIKHPDPLLMGRALCFLNNKHLLTAANVKTVTSHSQPDNCAEALELLHRAQLLTEENCAAIINVHTPSLVIAKLMLELHHHQILTEENRQTLTKHLSPATFVKALTTLAAFNALTPENQQKLAQKPLLPHNGIFFLRLLEILGRSRLLAPIHNQQFFDAFLKHSNFLTGSLYLINYWSQVDLLTETQFRHIIHLCEEQTSDLAIIAYMNAQRIIRHRNPLPTIQLNDKESTHTQSVHESVSQSATRLYTRYKDKINTKNITLIFSTIHETLHKLKLEDIGITADSPISTQQQKTLELKSARKCIATLKSSEYKDPQSALSINQLVALVWLSLNDTQTRAKETTTQQIHEILVNTLYQIERGNNLSETGQDNNKSTNRICPAGAFNKLVESLLSIDPDVEVIIHNKALVNLRLSALVKQRVITHWVNSFSNATELQIEANEAHKNELIMTGIHDDLWRLLAPEIGDLIFAEYPSLFRSRNDSLFTRFLETGQDITFKESDFEIAKKKLTIAKNPNGFFSLQTSTLPAPEPEQVLVLDV